MTVTYTQYYTVPALRRFFWAQETPTAGTSIAANSASWFQEGGDISCTFQIANYESREPIGLPVDVNDVVRLTEHTACTVNLPYRASGFAAYALASLMGDVTNTGASDTFSVGPDPFTHTILPGTKGARCNPFSLVYDTGSALKSDGTTAKGVNSFLTTYNMVESVTLTYTPQAPLMASITLMGSFPVSAYATALASSAAGIVTAPSAATLVTPRTRTLSYQGAYTLYANAGSTVYGVNSVATSYISGSVTVSRTVSPFFTSSQNTLQAYDFQSGPLGFSVNMDCEFDAMVAGTIIDDFLKDNASGSSSSKNSLKWTDNNSPAHSVEFRFYPSKWTGSPTFDQGGQQQGRTLSGTLTAYQDPTNVTTLTAPQSIILVNPVSGAMIN